MATQVVAIRVASPGTHEQHITNFKLSTSEEFTTYQMLISLKLSPGAFYTNANGKKAELISAKTESGTEYVKTKADSTRENNLLSLPRF